MGRFNRSQYDAGLKHGWRSGLEEKVCGALKSQGIAYEYESFTITFTPPAKLRRYKPDVLLSNGIVVELKGRFVTADRQKHIAVQAEHPALDIRFVFSNARSRISKASKTTYAMWCDTHGFQWADKGVIPDAWLKEPRNVASMAVIRGFK